MAFSLSKISEFFGLAEEEETYGTPKPAQTVKPKTEARVAPQPQSTYRPAARPVQSAPRPVQPVQQPAPKKVVAMQKPQPVRTQQSAAKVAKPVQPRAAKQTQSQTAAINQQATRPVRKEASRKISVVEPKVYSEAMAIARKIESGEAVLVNFQSIDEMKARRIVDFLTGVVFIADGDIKRVGSEMFICTPPNVEIDSSTLRNLQEEDIFGLGM